MPNKHLLIENVTISETKYMFIFFSYVECPPQKYRIFGKLLKNEATAISKPLQFDCACHQEVNSWYQILSYTMYFFTLVIIFPTCKLCTDYYERLHNTKSVPIKLLHRIPQYKPRGFHIRFVYLICNILTYEVLTCTVACYPILSFYSKN